MRAVVPFVALAAVLALAGCGEKRHNSSSSGASSPASISETEFKLTTSGSVSPGSTITVKNDGSTTHALDIEQPNGEIKTRPLKPGDSVEVQAPDKAGTYEMYCPIDGHKQKGMKAELTVGGASSGGGGTTTDSGGGGGSPGGY